MRLARILIDVGWKNDLLRLFIRSNRYRKALTPSKGRGLKPGDTPISQWRKEPGEKARRAVELGSRQGRGPTETAPIDANAWKDRTASMLTRPLGQKGGVTLFGDRPADHELLALHLSSEYPVLTEAKGAAVNEWTRRVDRENHLFDCLTGACVAASLEGISPPGSLGEMVNPPKRPRLKMSDLQRAARGQVGRIGGGL